MAIDFLLFEMLHPHSRKSLLISCSSGHVTLNWRHRWVFFRRRLHHILNKYNDRKRVRNDICRCRRWRQNIFIEKFASPSFNIFERFRIGDIVNEYSAISSTIKCDYETFEIVLDRPPHSKMEKSRHEVVQSVTTTASLLTNSGRMVALCWPVRELARAVAIR